MLSGAILGEPGAHLVDSMSALEVTACVKIVLVVVSWFAAVCSADDGVQAMAARPSLAILLLCNKLAVASTDPQGLGVAGLPGKSLCVCVFVHSPL